MMNTKGLNDLVKMSIETYDRHTKDLVTIGCVMTNQARKDWGLCAAVCAELVRQMPNVRFWWHVDTVVRTWDLGALIVDYGLSAHVEITLPPMDDAELARRYRLCDLTILPSLGEGFGYPIFESIACGTPCIHGDYAGGASLMKTCRLDYWLVEAEDNFRLESQQNCLRPIYAKGTWVTMIMRILESRKGPVDPISQHVDHLSWDKLKYPWRRWLRDGLVGK